jgi:hypothetical protein
LHAILAYPGRAHAPKSEASIRSHAVSPAQKRIVKLRNLLTHDSGWSDAAMDRVLEAIRTNAPDETDEVVHRILDEMR